ncbi:TPA: TetR/AcrR family transcriptional regulator, partial [Burkholderia multivorans]|nr:TetR/AcrR family transcriptional regulator [Burkholderia multivorans]
SYSHMMLEYTALPTRQAEFKRTVLEVALNLLGD